MKNILHQDSEMCMHVLIKNIGPEHKLLQFSFL